MDSAFHIMCKKDAISLILTDHTAAKLGNLFQPIALRRPNLHVSLAFLSAIGLNTFFLFQANMLIWGTTTDPGTKTLTLRLMFKACTRSSDRCTHNYMLMCGEN